MNKLKDTSLFVIVVIFLIVITVGNTYDKAKTPNEIFGEIDKNRNGVLSRGEFKYYMEKLEKNKSLPKASSMSLTIVKGLVQGVVMGAILNDFEGGVILSLILSAVNPLMYIVEQMV